MGGRFGVIVLVFLGLLTWSCAARNPILLEPFESAHENQVCEFCDKYVTLAIDYLQEDDNQNSIVEALHLSCSQIPPLKKQCLSMVDHYTQLFFTQVSEFKSDQICKKLNLCQAMTESALASQVHQGNCDACRQTVSEVITKLKDPETKLKIIRFLLKECKTLNNNQDKCKKLVFEYGPLMLADVEKFLEKNDVCSILRVCPATHRDYIPALEAVADV
ncbi:Cyclin-B1-5 [Cardamine amara subsp. amara]|uniref:Pulmonary surfactant-associated protein B n=1 Tax=Cardamine amara subsp. amara TaxID=228776 RepID=A0ABD1ACI4_CARAN